MITVALLLGIGQSFTCTPTHVWSADGPIWCAEGIHFRLFGIKARQPGDSCPERACPTMSGVDARKTLVNLLLPERTQDTQRGHVQLVGAPPLRCVWKIPVERMPSATCTAVAARGLAIPTGRDVACALIFHRAATEWQRYSKGALRKCPASAPVST